MEVVHLPQNQVSVVEEKTFYQKVLSKFYRNNKFNFSVNFSSVLSP